MKPEARRKMAAWIVLVIGLFAVVSGVSLGLKTWQITRWPTVEGRVVSRKVEWGGPEAVGAGPPAFRFVPKVTYLYEVNGTKFEGGRIRYSSRVGKKKYAQAIVDALPDIVTVHYNPENPAEAYLFMDSLVLPIGITAFGLVAALGAALYLIGSSPGP